MNIEETRRLEHVKAYGSFLYCPKKDTLCSYQEENVQKGIECARRPCILDDPRDIERKKVIAANRIAQQIENAKRPKEEPCAPIRSPKKTRRDPRLELIEKLERESEAAYKRNKPNLGEEKLQKAIMLRAQLRSEAGR